MRLTTQMASWKSLSLLSFLVLLQLSGCRTSSEDNDTTNTFVVIVSMASTQGDDLNSDVCIDVDGVCSVQNDVGEVVMEAQVKNLKDVSSVVNDIVFTRYRVTFVRADGRNVPGVDVPFPFDGVANFRVPADQSASYPHVLARACPGEARIPSTGAPHSWGLKGDLHDRPR